VEREVEAYRDFRSTCGTLIEVSEAICDARPVEAMGQERKRCLPTPSRARSSPKSKP
jgi:predicted nucleic acid-binding Zn ribbon protein